MKNEPVVTLVVGLIAAVGALLAAFGVHVTDAQVGALSGVAVAALALAFYVRSRVVPLGKAPANPGIRDERGQAEPLTLLVYVIVVIILVVVLFKVLDHI